MKLLELGMIASGAAIIIFGLAIVITWVRYLATFLES